MLTIHHLATSQSERIVWLCEELSLDYELRRYERRADNRLAPDEYKALHPMGIAPVIVDGDLVLGESGAICDYLNQKHGAGRLAPSPDEAAFADHLFWFHWSNATFMGALIAQLAIKLATDGASPKTFVGDRLTRCWDMIEQRLGQATHFGGEQLTIADIMMVYCLTTARVFRGTSIEDRPNLLAYLQRIGARPAYRRSPETATTRLSRNNDVRLLQPNEARDRAFRLNSQSGEISRDKLGIVVHDQGPFEGIYVQRKELVDEAASFFLRLAVLVD